MLDKIGMSMKTAINVLLKRTVCDCCIPFDLCTKTPLYEAMAEQAYKPNFDQNGFSILPANRDEDDVRCEGLKPGHPVCPL